MARKTATKKTKLHDCPGCVERGRSPRSRIAFPGVCINCSTPAPLAERPEQPPSPPGVRWCLQCEFDGAWTAAEPDEDYCTAHRPPPSSEPPACKAKAPQPDEGVSLEAWRLQARDKVPRALRVWLREARADLERHGRRSFAGQEAAKRIQAAEEELKARGLTEDPPPSSPDALQARWDAEETADFFAQVRKLKDRVRSAQAAVEGGRADYQAAREERRDADRALSDALDQDLGVVGPAVHMERLRGLSLAADVAVDAEREARQALDQAKLSRRIASEALRSAVRGWFERTPLFDYARENGPATKPEPDPEPKRKGAKARGR